MKINWLTLICFLFIFSQVSAQKHDYIWLGGQYSPGATPPHYNFYFDFTDFPPVVAIDSAVMQGFYNQSLTMCDADGGLQFYTTGCHIENHEDVIMEHGDSLNFGIVYDGYCPSHYPSDRGMVPIPMANNQYELFHFRVNTVDTAFYPACTVRELLHTRIDMNANQGEGEVIEKNQMLMTGCFQVASANRHANGRDWWLLTANNKVDTFYRFLVTPESIEGPWTQAIENPSVDGINYFCGQAAFSPNGSTYMINGCRFGVAVYDFDRCTGLLSNLRTAPNPVGQLSYYGATFSPNNRYIYVDLNDGQYLDQLDLFAPDLAASRTTVAVWEEYYTSWFGATIFGPSYPGPDGKIYIGTQGFSHIIEYPNRPGTACKVIQRSIELPTAGRMAPMYFPNYRLGPLDNSSCDTLGLDNLPVALFRYEVADTTDPLILQFTDLSWYGPTVWSWTFGDGTTSQDSCPLHTFPGPGLYTVCLVVSNENAADTLCQQIEVGEVSEVHNLPVLPQASVSPNPFGGSLTVRLPVRVGMTPRFVLYDALGRRCVSTDLGNFETIMSLEHLPDGLYFWALQFNKRTVQVGKVIKLHD